MALYGGCSSVGGETWEDRKKKFCNKIKFKNMCFTTFEKNKIDGVCVRRGQTHKEEKCQFWQKTKTKKIEIGSGQLVIGCGGGEVAFLNFLSLF